VVFKPLLIIAIQATAINAIDEEAIRSP